MPFPHYGYSGVSRRPNEDIIEDFIAQAENLYGPRFPGVTFAVQVAPSGPLHSDFDSSTNRVTVRLPDGLSENDRIGQCAQESIHVLSPATSREATVFDIGLATLFAIRVHNYTPPAHKHDYRAAATVVEWLTFMCPNAIQALRSSQPRVALLQESDILHVCNALPRYAAQFLVQRIY
jgi:hypothetical protein